MTYDQLLNWILENGPFLIMVALLSIGALAYNEYSKPEGR